MSTAEDTEEKIEIREEFSDQDELNSATSWSLSRTQEDSIPENLEPTDDIGEDFPPPPEDELTLEMDGETYVISAIVENSTGEVLNVVNLTEVEEDIETESYDPSDLIIVKENGTFEDDLMFGLEEEPNECPLVVEYQDMPNFQMNSEVTVEPSANQVEKTKRTRKRKLVKSRVRNKDIMELPFSYSGQSFTVQAQKLILNVYDFFKRTQSDPYALKKAGSLHEQAAKVLNVCPAVVSKVQNKFKTYGRIVVQSSNRFVVPTKRILDYVDKEKETVIRNIVRDLIRHNVKPTVGNVMVQALEKDAFKGSSTSFRRVLRRMKFRLAKSGNRMVLVE